MILLSRSAIRQSWMTFPQIQGGCSLLSWSFAAVTRLRQSGQRTIVSLNPRNFRLIYVFETSCQENRTGRALCSKVAHAESTRL
jgi:hypothetical protein